MAAQTAFDGLHPRRSADEDSGDNKGRSEKLDSEEKASQSVRDDPGSQAVCRRGQEGQGRVNAQTAFDDYLHPWRSAVEDSGDNKGLGCSVVHSFVATAKPVKMKKATQTMEEIYTDDVV